MEIDVQNRHAWLAAVLLYTALISYYSLAEPSRLEAVPGVGQVQGIWGGFFTHLGAYLVLGALWRLEGRGIGSGIALSVATGLVLEAVQSLTPYREVSLSDAAANTLGSLLGVLFLSRLTMRYLPGTPSTRR